MLYQLKSLCSIKNSPSKNRTVNNKGWFLFNRFKWYSTEINFLFGILTRFVLSVISYELVRKMQCDELHQQIAMSEMFERKNLQSCIKHLELFLNPCRCLMSGNIAVHNAFFQSSKAMKLLVIALHSFLLSFFTLLKKKLGDTFLENVCFSRNTHNSSF